MAEIPSTFSNIARVCVFLVFLFEAHGVAAQSPALPKLQFVRDLQTPGPISKVIWSSDGSKIGAASLIANAGGFGLQVPSLFGNLITIWNSDGQVFQKLQRDQPFFTVGDSFAFVAADRKIVAPASVTSGSLAFSLFDLDTGKIVREIAGPQPDKSWNVNSAKALVTSPDQTTLGVVFGYALPQPERVYSTKDWTKLPALPLESPTNFANAPSVMSFSKNSRLFAVNRGRRVFIYDLSSKQIARIIEPFPEPEHGVFSGSISFSPDDSMIAFGARSSATRRQLPYGDSEIVPPRNLVRLFRVREGSTVAIYPGSAYPVNCLVWSPNGRFIAFVTAGRKIHLWDPFRADVTEQTIDLDGEVLSLAFSPNGEMFAAGVGNRVRLFRVAQ